MAGLALSLTQMEILLDSNMLGVLIWCYFYLLIIIFAGFLNVYSLDKYEYIHNQQKCFKLKHNVFFIISYSKDKRIVSKKTFLMEILGYIFTLASIAMCIISLWLDVKTAFILLAVMGVIDFAFGITTGIMSRKIKNPIDFSIK